MSNVQKLKFIFLVVTAYMIGDIKVAGIGLAVLAMAIVGMESLLELLLVAKNKGLTGLLQRFLIVCGLIVFFIVLAIIVNITTIADLPGTLRRLVYICCCIAACGSLALQVRNTNDIDFIMNVFISITTVSSIFVIGQSFNMPWAWSLARTGVDEMEGYASAQRFSGLSPSVVIYAYQCSSCLAYLILRGKQSCKRKYYYFAIIINAVGLVLNRTRSALLAVIAVLIYSFLFSKRSVRKKIILVFGTVLAAAAVFMISDGTFGLGENLSFIMRSSESKNAGSLARIPMFLTAFNHAFHNPFGVGEYHADPNLLVGTTSRTAPYVLRYGCHNMIANCVANYGFFGLAAMLYLYYKLYDYYKTTNRIVENMCHRVDSLIRVNTGVFAAIIVSAFNGCFHNNYILAEDVASWVFFGLLIAVIKIAFFYSNESIYLDAK